jgi:hypothetical protein
MTITASIIGSNFLCVMLSGVTHTINTDHAHYSQIREALKIKDHTEVERLINIKQSVINFSQGHVTVRDGEVFYLDLPVRGSVVTRILDMIRENFDAQPMLCFLNNLMDNPSKRAVDELYGFLEATALPITEDGCFLAYKKVNSNYRDFYTGKMDNSVGQVLEMERNQVDDNRDRTCSEGLHFCSLSYLPHYHGGRGRVMIVKINPADVVSIPSDYNNAKGRAARYEVIGEHTSELEEAFTHSVYTAKGEVYTAPADAESDDAEYNADYDAGYADGSAAAEEASEACAEYDNNPPGDNTDAYVDGFEDGYCDNYRRDWQTEGYDNGGNDGTSGAAYDDTPPDDCDEHSEYRNGYLDGWHSAKAALI